MGCLFSHEADERDRINQRECYVRTQRVVTVTGRGEPSLQERYVTPIVPVRKATHRDEALYGEFKCSSCGRYWRSLLSWRNAYQICKRCKARVYPTNQRELLPSDKTRDRDDVGEHPKEFCQKCQQLGRYCGRSNKNVQRNSKWSY